MKILVCGSRTWTDEVLIHDELCHAAASALCKEEIFIIHGGAEGPDAMVGRIVRTFAS